MAIHLAAFQQPASAAPFDWKDCSACPIREQVNYAYNSRDPNEVRPNPYAGEELTWPDNWGAAWDYPASAGPGDHYGSAIQDLDHLLYANGKVQEVFFRFSRFELVDGLDYLTIWNAGSTASSYTGQQPGGWFLSHTAYRTTTNTYSFASNPIVFRFHTLDSYERGFTGGAAPPYHPLGFPYHPFLNDLRNYETDDGFRIGLTSVCCDQLAVGPTIELIPTTRHQLLLLGEGDTLFFHYPNDRADVDNIVAIWENDIASDATYDIYAKCNAPPSHDNYDLSTKNNTETINQALLLEDEFCTVPGTWHIAVHQEAGAESGTVNLVVSPHYENRRRHVDVGFDCTANDCSIAQAKGTLQEAARFFYGATEGSHVIKSIEIHQTSSCNDCNGQTCDLCWSDVGGASNWNGSYTTITRQFWAAPSGVAHEWGHQYMGLPDEYVNAGELYNCGHSIMAAQWLTNNLCGPNDHWRDTIPGAGSVSPASSGAVWPHGSAPFSFSNALDSYDYFEHPMGNYVGNIQVPGGGGGGSCRAGLGPLPSIGHLLLWLSALALSAIQRRKHPLRRNSSPRGALSGTAFLRRRRADG